MADVPAWPDPCGSYSIKITVMKRIQQILLSTMMWLSAAAISAQSTDHIGRVARTLPSGFWLEVAIFLGVAIVIVATMIYWERSPHEHRH